jgi:N6-adenosine-specific RNA methylase IME4
VGNKKYNIIYADPAWNYQTRFDDLMGSRGDGETYPTMTTEDICNLPIKNIADENCILFMWATFPCLIDAIKVIEAWGFEYKTLGFVWIKTNKKQDWVQTSFLPYESISLFWGMGYYTRANAEICLIGKRGKIEIINKDVHSVIISNIEKHSKKPIEVRDKIIRLVGDLPRVELFARENADGWDAWGNQVETSITF